jgi:type II secretory pathway pseudopilin PulG
MRAFSLAELMIAVGILGIGMMMIAMAFPVALDQTRQAVELSTSQLVFNEAVNTLKTQVKWTELEKYIHDSDNDNYSSPPSPYDLNQSNNAEDIRLINFNAGTTYFSNFYNGTDFLEEKLIYSADDTYGWVAAVQKISNRTYKFWIFVLREPRTLTGLTPRLELVTNSPVNVVNGLSGKILRFVYNDSHPEYFTLQKGESMLNSDGNLYTVNEIGEPDGTNISVMLDRDAPTAAYNYNYFAHVVDTSGTGFTRKNPVLTVYQTVISY